MQGVTFDTGALVAFERGDKRIRAVVKGARARSIEVVVPAVVLAEWWREGFGPRHEDLLRPLRVEPTTGRVAKLAGVALTRIRVSPVDAIVMASAAQRGDIVYTSNVPDLQALQAHFPGVRVLSATG